MKALISVYDKSGIEDFGDALDRSGFDLISTGEHHMFLLY